MDIRKEIIKNLGIDEKYFVNKLVDNKIGVIKLAFVREVINPMIIRNNAANEVNTFNAPDGRELVEIPARKLKSKEKRLGLMICRSKNVVDEGVRYNSIFDVKHLANPNSVLFGDSVTQSDGGALVSRVVYDWAYSLRDVDNQSETISKELQHNSLSEDGTIIKDRDVTIKAKSKSGTKVASQSLHSVKYVMPGTLFPHFVTIDNTTPELLAHLLYCILNEHKYGAQSTTMGSNMNNHLIGIAFSDFEKPINSYTISKDWYVQQNATKEGEKQTATVSNLTAFMKGEITKHYKKGFNDKVEGITNWLEIFWEDGKKSQTAYNQAKQDAETYLKALKMI